MPDKWLFGWRVQSAIPLPELIDWCGDTHLPDVCITLQESIETPQDWNAFGPAVMLGPRQQLLLTIPMVARYLVADGNRITIEPFMSAESPDVRTFLFGTCLAVLCFQRGMLPFHASAVKIADKAVLLAGNSGLGKSSLAAALHQRGHSFLSDDLCAIEFQESASPLLWPAFPRMKLSEEATEHLNIATAGAEQSRIQLQKFHIPLSADGFLPSPLPIGLIIALERSAPSTPLQIERLKGIAILQQRHLVHRTLLGEVMGYGPFIFHGLASLAQATPVVTLTRPDNLAALPELVKTVETLAQSEQP